MTPFDPHQSAVRHGITRVESADGHLGWMVTTYSAARTVLSDPRFSARQELKHPLNPLAKPNDIREPAAPGWFPAMDPPEHTHYRRMLQGQFTVRRMRLLEERIRQITDERLDAMWAAGPPVDLVQVFALPIPSLVICELLGVPYEDHAFFQEQTAFIANRDPRAQEATAALMAYMAGLVAAKREEPDEALISGLIEAGALTDEELTNIAVALLVAGHETTANMIGLGVLALLDRPEQLADLRKDPETAVEELLRHLTIIGEGAPIRAALEDVELDGTLIRAGETVSLGLAAINRDPGQFDEPAQLRLDRDGARQHLAFGHGVHLCLGHQLARLELRIAYLALFDRFPGLRSVLPIDEVPLKDTAAVLGVRELPVTWLTGSPAD